MEQGYTRNRGSDYGCYMNRAESIYQERITPSLGVTISLLALDLSIAFALWAALGEAIALTFLAFALLLSSIWWSNAIHRITVADGFLEVNRARISLGHVGEVQVLDRRSWRDRLGVEYDPRLFHAHRFWIRSGVQITLLDPRDPHPAWLIGSKRNLELADAINGARRSD